MPKTDGADMKIVEGIIGLIVSFYIVYTPIYVLFFNSAEDAAKSVSPVSVIENMADIVSDLGSKRGEVLLKATAKNVKRLADEYKDKYNIDLYMPLYKKLKKDKNVKDVVLHQPLRYLPHNMFNMLLAK